MTNLMSSGTFANICFGYIDFMFFEYAGYEKSLLGVFLCQKLLFGVDASYPQPQKPILNINPPVCFRCFPAEMFAFPSKLCKFHIDNSLKSHFPVIVFLIPAENVCCHNCHTVFTWSGGVVTGGCNIPEQHPGGYIQGRRQPRKSGVEER